MSEAVADTVWDWIEDMPSRIRRQMADEFEIPEELMACYEDVPVCLIFEDEKLIAAITMENDVGTSGEYDCHMFSSRRLSTETLRDGIRAFFDAMEADRDVHKLVFCVRLKQFRLGRHLIDAGCEFSGWFFYDAGDVFAVMVKMLSQDTKRFKMENGKINSGKVAVSMLSRSDVLTFSEFVH